MRNHFFSIIIPVKEINDYIRESIPKILELENQDFEIIILPNEDNIPFVAIKTQIIPSGKVWPAQKRNMWAEICKWDILCFLDDDAYPNTDWVSNVIKYFEDENVVAVWWPWITPDDDDFWAKVSGAVFLTPLGWANPDRYLPLGKAKQVKDWPSVNLFVRKKDFLKIWGFDNDYWPWEDTKLCLDLIKQTGKKIMYAPDVIVHHHRRPWLMKHLKQLWNYGLHRGHFFLKWDFRIIYLVPTLFVLFILFGGILSIIFWWIILKLYLLGIIVYLLALVVSFIDICIKIKKISIAFFSLFYIFLTHIAYGTMFLKWLLNKNLKSKLR